MRDIRFRAWDKTDKQMITWERTVIEGIDYGVCLWRCANLNNDYYEIMQFTGLYDCKGKEIYEGDILSWYGFGGMVDKPNLRVMTWEKGKFEPTSTFLNDDTLVYEIVGNIYENGDLLI